MLVYSRTDTSGVWLSVEHYDAYIPGSGILVWHINDDIIARKRYENAINNDLYRRGIDLLEADGIQDIGALLGFGDERVEYTEGHDDDTLKLGGKSILSPYSTPDTGSMWGAYSGITIEALSTPSDTMRVKITFSGAMSGFPISFEDNSAGATVTAANLLNNTGDDLLQFTGNAFNIIHSRGKNYLYSNNFITSTCFILRQ